MTEFSTLGVCLAGRADKKALLQIPWAATESMLMRNSDGGVVLPMKTEGNAAPG